MAAEDLLFLKVKNLVLLHCGIYYVSHILYGTSVAASMSFH